MARQAVLGRGNGEVGEQGLLEAAFALRTDGREGPRARWYVSRWVKAVAFKKYVLHGNCGGGPAGYPMAVVTGSRVR